MQDIKEYLAKIDIHSYKHILLGRVKSYEVDRQNIVHNAVYLLWLEEARIEYFRAIGITIGIDTFISNHRFVVAKNEINYISPALFDQQYSILSRISEINNTSLVFDQIILSASKDILVIAFGVLVHLHPETHLPDRIQDKYRTMIADYQGYFL